LCVCLYINWKVHAACDLTSLSKVKDFSRSQAVMHTGKVVYLRNGTRYTHACMHTHTHPFYGPLDFEITWVSQYKNQFGFY